jgi:hypothetical protein
LKRLTIIFDCGCSLTLWAERKELKEATHCCEQHAYQAADPVPIEGKRVFTVSIEPSSEPPPPSHSLGSRR